MSSLAQEEARSISENTTWGIRKAFSDGGASIPYSHFFGYDKGENGEFVINEKYRGDCLLQKTFTVDYLTKKIKTNEGEEAYKAADEAIRKSGARNKLLGSMIRQVKELEAPVTEFDAGLWGAFVDRMTVMADGKKVVRFKDGNEVEIQ